MISLNTFIQIQCRNMISSVEVFLKSCEMAAEKDDGKISADERKTLNAIRKASETYIKDLQRLL